MNKGNLCVISCGVFLISSILGFAESGPQFSNRRNEAFGTSLERLEQIRNDLLQKRESGLVSGGLSDEFDNDKLARLDRRIFSLMLMKRQSGLEFASDPGELVKQAWEWLEQVRKMAKQSLARSSNSSALPDTLKEVMPPNLVGQALLANEYSYVLNKQHWDAMIYEAELRLLYALILQYADNNNGALPEKLNDVHHEDKVDTSRYSYFSYLHKDHLPHTALLLTSNFLLRIGNENVVFCTEDRELIVIPISEYKKRVEKNKQIRLHHQMRSRDMVPQVLALSGSGNLVRLTKINYEEIVKIENIKRAEAGSPLIPLAIFEEAFADVDSDIYNYMIKHEPHTDLEGNPLVF